MRGYDVQEVFGITRLTNDIIDIQVARHAVRVVSRAHQDERNGADCRNLKLLASQFCPVHHGHVEITSSKEGAS